MKIKHYYYFGDSLKGSSDSSILSEKNWDTLRMADEKGPFAIEKSVEEYEANCMQSSSYIDIAKIVCTQLGGRFTVLYHVGLGRAFWSGILKGFALS